MASTSGRPGNLTDSQQAALSALWERSVTWQPQPIVLWGTPLTKELGLRQKIILCKFLRARNWDVDKADAMFQACLKWRKDFNIEELANEKFPESLTSCGGILGKDKDGCPVTYSFYGGMDMSTVLDEAGIDRFVRWRVQLMERAIAMCDWEAGVEKVLQVHDYSDANMFKMPPGMKAASKRIISLFQDNYPEFLQAKLFINVPRVMEFLFGIISAFSDPATKKKFQMIGPQPAATAALLAHVNLDQLPERYGGLQQEGSEAATSAPAAGSNAKLESGEAVIKSGKPHVITVDVETAPATVYWAAAATSGAISASVSFVPATEASSEASAQAGQGASTAEEGALAQSSYLPLAQRTLPVTQPGKVVLTLSNTAWGVLWVSEAAAKWAVRVQPSSS